MPSPRSGWRLSLKSRSLRADPVGMSDSARWIITLRYPSRCAQCGCQLEEGSEAWWDGEAHNVTCLACKVEAPADPFAGVDADPRGVPGGSEVPVRTHGRRRLIVGAVLLTAAVGGVALWAVLRHTPSPGVADVPYRPEMQAIFLSKTRGFLLEHAQQTPSDEELVRAARRYCTDRSDGMDAESAMDNIVESDDLARLRIEDAVIASAAVAVLADETVCTDYHPAVREGRPGTSTDPAAPDYESLKAFLTRISGSAPPPGSLGDTARSRAAPSVEWVFLESAGVISSVDPSELPMAADEALVGGYLFCLTASANGIENAITVMGLSELGERGPAIGVAAAMQLCPEFYFHLPGA